MLRKVGRFGRVMVIPFCVACHFWVGEPRSKCGDQTADALRLSETAARISGWVEHKLAHGVRRGLLQLLDEVRLGAVDRAEAP